MCRTPKISIHPPRAGRDLLVLTERLTRFISIHPPRAGRDQMRVVGIHAQHHFNPPAPCGAGQLQLCKLRGQLDFNPPAPCGAGQFLPPLCALPHLFQSTRPVRGGTRTPPAQVVIFCDFNPPAPCGAGLGFQGLSLDVTNISIHPPRAGRDVHPSPEAPARIDISIHPPRAGRDIYTLLKDSLKTISIHPPRAGRDRKAQRIFSSVRDFNPPAPCGAGRY